MYVGIGKCTLWIDGNKELKYKNSILQKIKARVKQKFNVSVAEVDSDPNKADFLTIAFAAVGDSTDVLQSQLSKSINVVEELSLGRVEDDNVEIMLYE